MAQFSDGMNIGEIRQLAKDLGQVARQVEGIVMQLDGRVTSTTWVGKDSRDFKSRWWPQDQSSCASWSTIFAATARVRTTTPTTRSGLAVAVRLRTAPPRYRRLPAARRATMASVGADQWAARQERSTDLVARGRRYSRRMSRRGRVLDSDLMRREGLTSTSVSPGRSSGPVNSDFTGAFPDGNGGVMARNMDGTADAAPTLGAIVSNPDVCPPWGHVMVVEEGRGPGGEQQIRVSEMNTGRGAAGPGIDGYPDEYKNDQLYTKDATGSGAPVPPRADWFSGNWDDEDDIDIMTVIGR